MLKSFTVVVKNYTTKKGTSFQKITCKGSNLPLATAEVDEYYNVRVCDNSKAQFKKDSHEGIYEISFEDKGLWIDTRPEMVEKHIARVNAERIIYQRPLLPKQPVEEKTKSK